MWRSIRRRVSSRRAELVHHPDYGRALAIVEHDRDRASNILTFLVGEGLARPRRVRRPEAAPLPALRRIHTDAYVESLEDVEGLIDKLQELVDKLPPVIRQAAI